MQTKSYENLFDKYIQEKNIYESVVLVEREPGETVFSNAYGGKDIDSPIIAASITKMFTAACVFILVQQGFITLHDSLLNFYEPAYLKGLHFYKGKDYSYDLKISDLLYQTSGLADIYEEGRNSIKKQVIISDTCITFDKKILDMKQYRKLQLSMFPIYYGSGYMRIKMGGFSTSFLGQGDLIGHSGSTGSFAFYYPNKELFFVGDFNQMKYPALPIRFVMQLAMFAP